MKFCSGCILNDNRVCLRNCSVNISYSVKILGRQCHILCKRLSQSPSTNEKEICNVSVFSIFPNPKSSLQGQVQECNDGGSGEITS